VTAGKPVAGISGPFLNQIGILAISKMSTSRRSLSSTLGKRSSLMATSTSTAPASDLSVIPESSFVSTSAHSISSSPSPKPLHSYANQRSPSPPASSYFPSVSATQSGEPQPSPGAADHFAYSTTLRRHHHEASLSLQLTPNLAEIKSAVTAEGLPSLWQKAKGVVTRRLSQDTTENRYESVSMGARASPPPKLREDHGETPSARFAHWAVEVRARLQFRVITLCMCHGAFQFQSNPSRNSGSRRKFLFATS
jgi:P-type Ca2+ transporter type 2C